MEPEPSEQPKPEVKASGGGSDKPRRPTAVGQGGPNEEEGGEWEQKIADLRRYDLDSLNDGPLASWSVPGLTFVRADGVHRRREIGQEKQRQSQEEHDPSKPPKRRYILEDALVGLHGQKANLAFLVLGSKTGVHYYLGASLPGPYDSTDTGGASSTVFSTLSSLLQSVYDGVDIDKTPFTGETMKSMISPIANHIGIVTGIPHLDGSGGGTMETEQIERWAQGMQGHEFGVLILSVPIPNTYVNQEEFSVVDQIQKAKEIDDPEKRHRIKYYLELLDGHLKHIQLGTAVGMWQVGVYFFAADRSLFVRLQSLLKATYADETSRPTPWRTHEIKGLKEHLEQLALVKTQRTDCVLQTLRSYKLLTPLNSRMLSAYIHLPKRDMPGFHVARTP